MAMNKQFTSLSVVVPTFNRAGIISRAINSVLSQTFKADEIIIVDDGSTDATREIITQNYPMVKYFWKKNKGVSSARNFGIKTAKGDWIAFLDSDDEWLPQKLAKEMKSISENPDIKLCFTDEIWIRGGVRVNPKKRHAKHGGYIFRFCLPLCLISPSSVIIHRSIFEEVGLFDETLPVCEDYDLWLRICSRRPVLYLDEPLIVKYGGHNDQLSRQYWGMDRFRIYSLEKMIDSKYLDVADRIEAINILLKKLAIIIKGTCKRDKTDELGIFERKRNKYENLLRNILAYNKIQISNNPLRSVYVK
jgi:glycosyltransferase involved in cell wall biosynthesis